MNTILLFTVILVSSLTLASKKPDINALLFFTQQTANNCISPGLQCKDCHSIQYCSSSNLESLFEIRCEDQSRLRPYCDTGTNTCVKDMPKICEIPETNFHCPGTGYYPDLEDCANYYICDENKVATKMYCPAGSNWVQGNKTCTAAIYCRSYSPKLGQCKGKTNKLVGYAPDKNMYVLCLSNGPILFQCSNKWEVFDDAEVTCKFECTQNGFFPNPSDPTKFYSCLKVGKGYEATLLQCPEGYEFVELEVGQGVCTLSTTTTTTTTEAPTTIVDLTTILEQHTENIQEENRNDDEQNIEEDLTNNKNVVEHHAEELEEQTDETNHSGINNENEQIEVLHLDETVAETNNSGSNNSDDIEPENNASGDDSSIEENHEDQVIENEEIILEGSQNEGNDETNHDEIEDTNESQLF